MTRALLLILTVFLILVASAVASSYWPTEGEELVYTFIDDEGDELVITFYPGQGYYRIERGICSAAWSYTLDEAMLGLTYSTSYCEGDWEIVMSSHSPPLPLLTYHLEVGNLWWIGNSFAVVEEETTVTVPLGTYDVMAVRYYNNPWGNIMNIGGLTYFHAELGPVKIGGRNLVSIEATTPVRERSWSSVKSLFK